MSTLCAQPSTVVQGCVRILICCSLAFAAAPARTEIVTAATSESYAGGLQPLSDRLL